MSFSVVHWRGDGTGRIILSPAPDQRGTRRQTLAIALLLAAATTSSSMTAGIDWNESLPYADSRNTAIGLEASDDWLKYTIDRPMSEDPARGWNYNSGASAGKIWYLFLRNGMWDGRQIVSQGPMTFPQDDMVVVFNGWNILPGRPALPRGQVTARLVEAIIGP